MIPSRIQTMRKCAAFLLLMTSMTGTLFFPWRAGTGAAAETLSPSSHDSISTGQRVPLAELYELIGMEVVGAQGEEIGEITKVLVDEQGRVQAVVIQHGTAVLGMGGGGEVAIPFERLQLPKARPGMPAEERQARIDMTEEKLGELVEYEWEHTALQRDWEYLSGTRGIHDSSYAFLHDIGEEQEGYGLYSYVLFTNRHSSRAEAFLRTLFSTTDPAAESDVARKNINILYLPSHGDPPSNGAPETLAKIVYKDVYDYRLARALLARICSAPADAVADLCAGDLSRGPYLFTYAGPASNLSPVPPPYLFVDLSSVHERAFGEFIAAYKAQVKRTDYTDRERIGTFRLRLLSIILTGADVIEPIQAAMAQILRMAPGKE